MFKHDDERSMIWDRLSHVHTASNVRILLLVQAMLLGVFASPLTAAEVSLKKMAGGDAPM